MIPHDPYHQRDLFASSKYPYETEDSRMENPSPGDVVEFQNLAQAAHLNGTIGILVNFNEEHDRWEVKCERNNAVVRARLQNLRMKLQSYYPSQDYRFLVTGDTGVFNDEVLHGQVWSLMTDPFQVPTKTNLGHKNLTTVSHTWNNGSDVLHVISVNGASLLRVDLARLFPTIDDAKNALIRGSSHWGCGCVPTAGGVCVRKSKTEFPEKYRVDLSGSAFDDMPQEDY